MVKLRGKCKYPNFKKEGSDLTEVRQFGQRLTV